MKKKLAFLLAVVMLVGVLAPMNLFARTVSDATPTAITLPASGGWAPVITIEGSGFTGITPAALRAAVGTPTDLYSGFPVAGTLWVDIVAMTDTVLVIEVWAPENMAEGARYWDLFLPGTSPDVPTGVRVTQAGRLAGAGQRLPFFAPSLDITGRTIQWNNNQMFISRTLRAESAINPVTQNTFIAGRGDGTTLIGTTPANFGAGVNLVIPFDGAATGNELTVVLEGAVWAQHSAIRRDFGTTGAWLPNIDTTLFTTTAHVSGTDIISSFTTNAGYFNENRFQPTPGLVGGIHVPWTNVGLADIVGYTFTREAANRAVVTLGTFYDATEVQMGDRGYIVLPLVMVATGTDPITVTLVGAGGMTQSLVLPHGGAIIGTGTETTLDSGPVTAARGRVYLPAINIRELGPGALGTGWFGLIPPPGFNLVRVTGGNGTPIGGATPADWVAHDDSDWRVNNARITSTRWFTFVEGSNATAEPPRMAQALYVTRTGTTGLAGTLTIPANTFALQAIERDERLWFDEDALDMRIASWANLRGDTVVGVAAGTTFVTVVGFHSVEGMWEHQIANWTERTFHYTLRPYPVLGNIVVGAGDQAGRVTRGGSAAAHAAVRNIWITGSDASILDTNYGQLNPGITTEAFPVVVRDGWDIEFRRNADYPTDIWAGRANQQIASVTLESNTVTSWLVDRDTVFTLTNSAGQSLIDQVRITAVNVPGNAAGAANGDNLRHVLPVTGVGGISGARGITHRFLNAQEANTANPIFYPHALFAREGHQFILRDLRTPSGLGNWMPRITMQFYLSVSPDFYGDIFLTVQGGGLEDQFNPVSIANQRLHVATAHLPFTVETEATVVQMGHLVYEIEDITIIENIVPGLGRSLQGGDVLNIGVGAFGRTTLRAGQYMGFNPITRDNITTTIAGSDDRFRISDARTDRYGQLMITVADQARTPGTPGKIHLTNLTLDIDRTVPEGFYDLIIGLTNPAGRFASNIADTGTGLWLFDQFALDGHTAFEGFIEMGTHGAHRPFIRTVSIAPGDYVALVNDREVAMEAPPLMFENRVYVPIRFISHILGVDDRNIRWDPILRNVNITTAERNITFQDGSSTFIVNGMPSSMYTRAAWDWYTIVPAYPRFADEMHTWVHPTAANRLYIPVRFLAYAFGIDHVDFQDGHVIFNPTEQIPISADLYDAWNNNGNNNNNNN